MCVAPLSSVNLYLFTKNVHHKLLSINSYWLLVIVRCVNQIGHSSLPHIINNMINNLLLRNILYSLRAVRQIQHYYTLEHVEYKYPVLEERRRR